MEFIEQNQDIDTTNGNPEIKTSPEDVFPSAVSTEYFKDWDSLVLHGNPKLKDTIERNIQTSETNREEIYKRFADHNHLSVEEFKQKVQVAVELVAERSDFFRAVTPQELKSVLLGDGRFKSQIETGMTSSGTYDPNRRIEAERLMFGIDPDYPAEKRPIYGYISNGPHGVVNDFGQPERRNRLAVFGGVVIEFNKEAVKDKATIAFDDTYQYEETIPPTPYTKPHFVSLGLNSVSHLLLHPENLHSSVQSDLWFPCYIEAQFHDQLGVEHIKAIHVSEVNGLDAETINNIKADFALYKQGHPDSNIQLIEF